MAASVISHVKITLWDPEGNGFLRNTYFKGQPRVPGENDDVTLTVTVRMMKEHWITFGELKFMIKNLSQKYSPDNVFSAHRQIICYPYEDFNLISDVIALLETRDNDTISVQVRLFLSDVQKKYKLPVQGEEYQRLTRLGTQFYFKYILFFPYRYYHI